MSVGKVQDAPLSSSSVRVGRLEAPRAGKPCGDQNPGSCWSVRASTPPYGSPASATEGGSVLTPRLLRVPRLSHPLWFLPRSQWILKAARMEEQGRTS